MVNSFSFKAAVKYPSFLFDMGEFRNSFSQSLSDKQSIQLPLLSQYHSPVIYSTPAQSHHVKCSDLSKFLLPPRETNNPQLFFTTLSLHFLYIPDLQVKFLGYNDIHPICIHFAWLSWSVISPTPSYPSKSWNEEGELASANNERLKATKAYWCFLVQMSLFCL